MHFRTGVWIGLFLAAIGSAASATDSIEIWAEHAVYRTKSDAPALVRISNNGTAPASVRWKVAQGSTDVYQAQSLDVVWPGQTKSLSWGLKKSDGGWAPPGSYQVVVRATINGTIRTYSLTLALTQLGTIENLGVPFPLTVGNTWTYETSSKESVTNTISSFWQGGSFSPKWYWMTSPPAGSGWVTQVGFTDRSVYVSQGTSSQMLFLLDRPAHYAYPVGLPGLTRIEIAGGDQTVGTPVGLFVGCRRIDGYNGYEPVAAWWFAAGAGIVKYARKQNGVWKTYRLVSATLHGYDGGGYSIQRAKLLAN